MAGHLSFPLIFSDVSSGGSGLPAGGTDGQILLSDGAGSGTWADGAVGRTKVVSVPFAFDTPDLLTGAVIYTPTVGELLLDGWIEIVTAWDGTTPHADIGTFLNGSASGLFRRADSAIPADAIDDDTDNPGILVGTNSSAYSLAEKSVYGDIQRSAPAKFTVANPLCVIVTQEGTPGGTDPGSMVGAAIVHLVIWSPDEVGGVTGGLSVTDGSTTVSPVTSLTVTGATVTGSAGNATVDGLLPTSGLAAALAAQGVGALSLYGDGSDGDIDVNAPLFDFPDPTGIDAWQVGTVYNLGDQVKSTGTFVRVFELVGGQGLASGSSDPFPDGVAGTQRRGDRTFDNNTASGAFQYWEQVTAIYQSVVEGPVFADNFTIRAGMTLRCAGWPIYGRTSVTTEATSIISADGGNADGFTPGQNPESAVTATLLGVGTGGVGSGSEVPVGSTWGGGIGGYGGAGGDGPPINPGTSFASDAAGFTLGLRTPQLYFTPYFSGFGINPSVSIGSGGGPGQSDTALGQAVPRQAPGGSTGACGSRIAILTRQLTHNGIVTAKGGDGGDGDTSGQTGGAGGSSGGCCMFLYGSKTGTGTVDLSGGAGGSGHTMTFAITGVNTGTQTFTIATDQSTAFSAGKTFTVTGSTGNDATYTVDSATFDTDHTDIVVVEAIADATVDGNINQVGQDGGPGSPGDFVEFANA